MPTPNPTGEVQLAFAWTTWLKPFSHNLHRLWLAIDIKMDILVTDRRLAIVWTTNPYNSMFPFNLVDVFFYAPHVGPWREQAAAGNIDDALLTPLRKEVFPVGTITSVTLSSEKFAANDCVLVINLKDGVSRSYATNLGFHPADPAKAKEFAALPFEKKFGEIERRHGDFVAALHRFNEFCGK